MIEIGRTVVWTLCVAAGISYVTYLFFGSQFLAEADESVKTVSIRKTKLYDGSFRVSGMVMVPSACDEIRLRAAEISPHQYILSFTTWKEPSRDCIPVQTPRAFQWTHFANGSTSYEVFLDGVQLPTRVFASNAE